MSPGPANMCPDTLQWKRNRKREMDRISQQRKRKKDRENLQKMEERLQFLQKDGHNPLFVQLMKAADENEERNIRHRKRLLQIRGLIQADLADLGYNDSTNFAMGPNDDLQTRRESTDTSSHIQPNFLDQMLAECTDDTMMFTSNNDLTNSLGQAFPVTDGCEGLAPETDMLLWDPKEINVVNFADIQQLTIPPEKVLPQAGRSRVLWDEIEQLLARSQSNGDVASTDNEELDMHILISAVCRGWSQFSQVVNRDTRWTCLRELDERYFSKGYDQVDRLAVLTIASQLLDGNRKLNNSVGSKLLPLFMRPRPSQQAIPHSTIADFYVWPGFRERLTVCAQYYNDIFLNDMHLMFKFLWPHDLRAAYNVNPRTGMFFFSPQFLEHLGDLRCWTMKSDFLIQYPDFRGDIPILDVGPSHLLMSKVSYPEWYNFIHAEEEDPSEGNDDLQLALL